MCGNTYACWVLSVVIIEMSRRDLREQSSETAMRKEAFKETAVRCVNVKAGLGNAEPQFGSYLSLTNKHLSVLPFPPPLTLTLTLVRSRYLFSRLS